MISDTPAYNLKVVLREANIKADVLRAWERRYGLPKPQRTPGGHRLYSQRDIETVKWLVLRQGEGLSISRAVELWREIEAGSRDPLAEFRAAALSTTLTAPVSDADIVTLRQKWLEACLLFNEAEAEQVINQAFSVYPLEMVISDVLQHGMSELGEMWYRGEATVQQEHFTSALAIRRLDALIAASPAPSRPYTIVVGCPPEEWHTFTGLLITLFLRRRGLKVIYLGANVPANRFVETLDVIRPHLIVLSAQQLNTAATLQQTVNLLNEHGATVAYGGRIFGLHPAIIQHIPGYFLGSSLDDGIREIENLLITKPVSPQITMPSNQYTQALDAFIDKRPLIENMVSQLLRASNGDLEYTDMANIFMGNNIRAALQLEDIHYLDSEIEWLTTMLSISHLPDGTVVEYLKIYTEAVREHLGRSGTIILSWLESIIGVT